MAELKRLRAWNKAPKRRKLQLLRKYARDAALVRAEAERILATLPVELPLAIAERRAILVGDSGTAEMAKVYLAALDPDRQAAAHRKALLRALAGPPDASRDSPNGRNRSTRMPDPSRPDRLNTSSRGTHRDPTQRQLEHP